MSNKKRIKSALESMMFVWGQPLDVKSAADVFDISIPLPSCSFSS